MDELIRRAAQTIEDLGIATQAVLEPYLREWAERPPSHDTSDADRDLGGFLTTLFRAQIITRNQGRTLLGMLTETGQGAGDPNVGKRFGSYIAEALVGEGAMGKVYRAAHEETLDRDYVIKVFAKSDDKRGLSRFRREGELMSGLRHTNIVKVVSAGEAADHQPYIVLEYVEGPTLERMLEERGKFSWRSAARAIKQIASALAAAHEKGVIHRDIKPQNVLVAPGGMLKVFDFGLAKSLDSKAISQAGMILGSPAYMAPEQWGDHEVDERVDLFALGVTFYTLVAGRTPFRGRTPADYSHAIQLGTYEPLSRSVPEVPPAVEHLVAQLLERDRAYRPPSARAVGAELDRILKDKPPEVPRLERIDGDPRSDRLALVGSDSHRIGSGGDVQLRLDGLAAHHATVERTSSGYVMRDAGGGVRVDSRPIEEIVLRDKDEVELGEGGPRYRFVLGNLTRARGTGRPSDRIDRPSERLSPVSEDGEPPESAAPPFVINGLLAAALMEAAHPRALVSCFEALDPYSVSLLGLEPSREALAAVGVAPDAVERALDRARNLAQERVWRLADRLFSQTKENLGASAEAWIAWWLECRARYPRQLRPPGTRARGKLVVQPNKKKPAEQEVLLEEGEEWVVGRADDAEVTVPERSVSRQHVRIHRLHARFAFQDLGSRFGTTLGGNRQDVGLLRDGDVLELGQARLTFSDLLIDDPTSTRTGADAVEVDHLVFQALVEQRSPAAVLTLVRLLDTAMLAEFCVQAAAPHETFMTVGAHVMTFLDEQRLLALEALPGITGVNHGDDAAAWQQWWAQSGAAYGKQVQPAGWAST